LSTPYYYNGFADEVNREEVFNNPHTIRMDKWWSLSKMGVIMDIYETVPPFA